jgi:hypothetical protein
MAEEELAVYCATGPVAVGDLLTRHAGGAAVLTTEAAAGAIEVSTHTAVALQEGMWVVIGDNAQSELSRATDTEGTVLRLAWALRQGHAAGAAVAAVEVLEVVSVRDEAGRGHHTRAGARRLAH